MNRGQITRRVIQILGLDDTAGGEEALLVNDLINEAVLDVSRRTKLNMKILNIHLTAGNNSFLIPKGVLTMMDLRKMASATDPGNGIEMIQKHADEVMVDTSGLSYSIVGYDNLLVAGGSESDRDYRAWFVPMPSPMTTDNDDPSLENFGGIPEQFHYTAILNYVLWNGADYGDDITSQSGERYRLLYEGEDGRGGNLKDIHRMINKRATPGGRRGRPIDSYISNDYITSG
jgi:hypothetical protein